MVQLSRHQLMTCFPFGLSTKCVVDTEDAKHYATAYCREDCKTCSKDNTYKVKATWTFTKCGTMRNKNLRRLCLCICLRYAQFRTDWLVPCNFWFSALQRGPLDLREVHSWRRYSLSKRYSPTSPSLLAFFPFRRIIILSLEIKSLLYLLDNLGIIKIRSEVSFY